MATNEYCLVGRTARVAIREKTRVRIVNIAFPARWKKSTLLKYVRSVHNPKGHTVRLVEWGPLIYDKENEEPLWLANPSGFVDFNSGWLG